MKPVTWDFATYSGPFGVTGEAMKYFVKRLDEKTKGLFKINLHWSGALLGARDTPPGIRAGLVDMAYISTPDNPDKFPVTNMIDLPAIGPYSGPETIRTQWIPLVKAYREHPLVRDEVASWNLAPDLVLRIVYPPTEMAGVKALNTVEDFKGQKFGTSLNIAPLLAKTGAVWVNVPWGEGYSAIQNGLVQFTSEFSSSVASTKIYEVAPYLTMMDITYGGGFMGVVNQDSFNALPDGMKKILREVFEETNTWLVDETVKIDAAGIEKYKNLYKNVVYLPDAEKKKFIDIATVLWQERAKELKALGYPGDELLKFILDKRAGILGK
ncbi:MAG: hypothetical protein HY530_04590 [Chloroflexi bacterium]|nr:hypothetical protein [Chloroflexota bacterium]